MARLTETERDLIVAARLRGPHPFLRPQSVTDISAAALRRQADADRSEYLAALVTKVVSRLVLAFRRERLERQTCRALAALSDAVLTDIGVRRADIPDRARDHARTAYR